jgi:hypothetical protein
LIGLWLILEEDIFANSTGLVVDEDSVIGHVDDSSKMSVGSSESLASGKPLEDMMSVFVLRV